MPMHLTRGRFALPPPAAGLVRRAKIVLIAVAFLAAILLAIAGSWPLRVLVVLAFVRGLIVADVATMRNARPRPRSDPIQSTPVAA